MQSFISETIDTILKTTESFENVVFVLPSQRAGVFVKQTLKDKISAGFLPEIQNIGSFIEEVSETSKVDSVELLFHFYTIYKSVEKNPDSFDKFSSWAFTVLQDFNEIDQHLVNAKEIFVYLRDIERLKKWSVDGVFKETEMVKDHFSFVEKLGEFYPKLYAFLKEKNIGYQGLIYREATLKIDAYLKNNEHKKFFFIGFNALNNAEEVLFQKMLADHKTTIYWDIDAAFLDKKQQAGQFIRKYKSTWKHYEKADLNTIGTTFFDEKNIEVIGLSKNISQIKYAGEILSKLPKLQNTAMVLSDETLLPITLSSLPKNVDAINITMGYPLKDIPSTALIYSIFQLFLSQEKLQKTTENSFYHKDVIRFIKEPAIYKLLQQDTVSIADEIAIAIAKENNTFVNITDLNTSLQKLDSTTQKTISAIFNPFSTIADFISRILELINQLKEDTNQLEKEFLFRFHTIFMQLQNLHNDYHYFQNLKTLHLFFKQLIGSESLSFQGEPLKGLQLMGMLETRVLDFENVIITSVNEGILPANSQQQSFIPFDVKVEFDLPTYREKDAIFSYHFFRLLQRTKNVFILYNTEPDVFGSGEKSRFVTQLEMMRDDIQQKRISPKVVTEKATLKEIPKNDAVIKTLKKLAQKGISPSALTSYLYNPIKFYKQKVLKIRELDDVEETVAFNTLGTVVHETLDELYTPFVGHFLQADAVSEMLKKARPLVEKHFKIGFKSGDLKTGKNRLIFEVANRFVVNFLQQELTLLKEGNNQLKIIATEENLAATIEVEGLNFPIKIHGQVDRVDELNGVTRIIDYKSGMVSSTNLKVPTFSKIRDEKYHKAIQVLLYAFLYTKSKKYDFSKPLEAGIISFKNLKSGFLSTNFSTSRAKDHLITEEKLEEFIGEIKSFLIEIYDLETPFIEPPNLKY
jgi:hypothetical protein